MENANAEKKELRRKKRIRRLFLVLTVVLLFALAVAGLRFLTDNSHFEVTWYSLGSGKVEHGFRIALLTDLHEQEYGEGNSELVQAITDYQPDIIIMAGDMINKDDADVDVLLNLCEDISPVAPICFVLGNHEGTLMFDSGENNVPLDQYLSERGIDILYGGIRSITLNEDMVTLGAFSYSDEVIEEMDDSERAEVNSARKAFEKSEGFRIAISHYPDIYDDYLYGIEAELAVAGHLHGGVVRIPYLGGLFHPEYGLFPKYSGGKYYLERAVLIVSRGLGSHGGFPRVNNKPELVMIDIKPLQAESSGQ